MSFSGELKAELAALPIEKRCCATAELGAFIQGASLMTLSSGRQVRVSFRTENAAVLRRALHLFNFQGPAFARPQLLVRSRIAGRKIYLLQLSHEDTHRLLREQGMLRDDGQGHDAFSAPRRIMRRNCCRRAFLRGAFLACGYMADPRRGYNAEWTFQDQARAARLKRVMGQCGLQAAVRNRRGSSVVALKGGDQIAELLKNMGASRGVMEMENSRAQKSMRDTANRAVNCDRANLGRQLDAAARQVAAIEALSRSRGLNHLPPALETLARLRLTNPDASLEELGLLLTPPVSKSGVQHRMGKLMKFARDAETMDKTP